MSLDERLISISPRDERLRDDDSASTTARTSSGRMPLETPSIRVTNTHRPTAPTMRAADGGDPIRVTNTH